MFVRLPPCADAIQEGTAPTMSSAVPLMRVRAGSAAVTISALCVIVSFFSVLWKLYPGSGSVAEENGGRDRIRCPLIKAAGLSKHLISSRFRVPVIRIYVSTYYFSSMLEVGNLASSFRFALGLSFSSFLFDELFSISKACGELDGASETMYPSVHFYNAESVLGSRMTPFNFHAYPASCKFPCIAEVAGYFDPGRAVRFYW